ncbi:hypothetical protein [Cryobacterium sp. Y62]|uniref:hypothetical protein n=1 Tax=Cryobacterium sp. Y62 TaxID=2048284 RepID=UPI0013047F57|nr:hypothetical protein [Cryobacterium sp. Y62]
MLTISVIPHCEPDHENRDRYDGRYREDLSKRSLQAQRGDCNDQGDRQGGQDIN